VSVPTNFGTSHFGLMKVTSMVRRVTYLTTVKVTICTTTRL
jgi:hypothetical protein